MEASATPEVEDRAFLENYGLSANQTLESKGQSAVPFFISILSAIDSTELPLHRRILLSSHLLHWYTNSELDCKHDMYEQYYLRLIEVIKFIYLENDDFSRPLSIRSNDHQTEYSAPNTTYPYTDIPVSYENTQLPGYLLSILLAKYCVDFPEFMEKIQHDLMLKLRFMLDKKRTLKEFNELIDSATIRTSTLTNLISCLPRIADDQDELSTMTSVLIDVADQTLSASSLRIEALHRIKHISIVKKDDVSLFEGHIPQLLNVVYEGHNEIFSIIKKCKGFFNEKSQLLLDNLDVLMDKVGFDEFSELAERLMDLDVRKLISSVPTMISQIGKTIMKHKLLILGILLAIALVEIGPLLPLLATLASTCMSYSILFIPLFKIFTVVAKSNNEITIQCLLLVVKIAKTCGNMIFDNPSAKSAILETINVLKDGSKYSNIFHPDTLKVLEEFAAYNPAAYQNIVSWNQGKKARVGDGKDFLVNAGKVYESQKPRRGGLFGMFLGFGRSKSNSIENNRKMLDLNKASTAATSATALAASSNNEHHFSKKALVSPSPHSQNLALLEEAEAKTESNNPNLGGEIPPTPISKAFSMNLTSTPITMTITAENNQTSSTADLIVSNLKARKLFDEGNLSNMEEKPAVSTVLGHHADQSQAQAHSDKENDTRSLSAADEFVTSNSKNEKLDESQEVAVTKAGIFKSFLLPRPHTTGKIGIDMSPIPDAKTNVLISQTIEPGDDKLSRVSKSAILKQ